MTIKAGFFSQPHRESPTLFCRHPGSFCAAAVEITACPRRWHRHRLRAGAPVSAVQRLPSRRNLRLRPATTIPGWRRDSVANIH